MIQPTSLLDFAGISDIGLIRDHNEDVWAAYPERGLFLLADGMGGHAAGEVAASESVSYLHELVKKWHPTKQTSPDEAVSFFRDALAKVNTSIYQKGEQEPSLSGMGTTICALYIHQMHAILAHVGDSRIYRLRDGILEQLTEDHSLVSELVSLGAMKAEEGETFAYKHILTRAIGTHPTVEPSVNYLKINPQDCYLLCSDGLTNYVSDPEIETLLSNTTTLAERAQALVDLANENGGGDNITLILVKIHDLSR
ncbi:MAG: Stp1/IreP family PP2C-type Ser/Thr phosphatase [Chlamydiales bacterium]|nr:Stp1/IreP family PP2C-type Ser/Thr phosphatase [Chlamydiales bacterium]